MVLNSHVIMTPGRANETKTKTNTIFFTIDINVRRNEIYNSDV